MKLKKGAKFPWRTAKQLFHFPQRPAVSSNTKTFATWSMKSFGKESKDHPRRWEVLEPWDFPISLNSVGVIYLAQSSPPGWGGPWDHTPIIPHPPQDLALTGIAAEGPHEPWGHLGTLNNDHFSSMEGIWAQQGQAGFEKCHIPCLPTA